MSYHRGYLVHRLLDPMHDVAFVHMFANPEQRDEGDGSFETQW